ncbi:aldo/keto reductase [Ectobacillus antri]|jgi:aryl-alcohol dehydrogenase-like predicted oxidoreductase|uniref:Aldo/keto reductase n=1 Tax=Ectobacillus antri TaxID=2486280 RepID=A0ABT6H298_9BACI|nr:aldo/keto reductase [Ectobacillus antri]MDG4655679.1 aldo/keto reductase [Ectobacillus antri]MDG5753437.1 aldo/keto reductase [Ectobacillus antri]
MQKRQLGTSELWVSEVGLGCMSLGTEKQKAIRIIDTAIEQGINFLDTADLYDYGMNEEFIGTALKGRRDQIILATKVGNRWTANKNGWFWDPSKTYIKEQVKSSLQRLGTDYIDLYQLHGGTVEDYIDETIEAFEELQEEGWIRYYGISSIRPNVIKEYVSRSNIVSVLMEYSLLNRRPEELFPLLAEHNISVIARGSLAKGLLTNSGTQRIKESGYLSYSAEELQETLSHINNLTGNRSVGEVALRYCLHQPVVASVIPGASSVMQVQENVLLGTPLTSTEYEQLQQLTKQDIYTAHRD